MLLEYCKQLRLFDEFKKSLFFKQHLNICRAIDADVSDDDIAAETFKAFVIEAFVKHEFSSQWFYNEQQLIVMMNATYTRLVQQAHHSQEINIHFVYQSSFSATNPYRFSTPKIYPVESQSPRCCVIS